VIAHRPFPDEQPVSRKGGTMIAALGGLGIVGIIVLIVVVLAILFLVRR
jgi:hypothetical protein